jgi:hypothetical protein
MLIKEFKEYKEFEELEDGKGRNGDAAPGGGDALPRARDLTMLTPATGCGRKT